jgi:hypothetical protein
MQRLRDAPGDRMLVGDPHDKAFFAFHKAFKRHEKTPRYSGIDTNHLGQIRQL